MHEMRFWYSPAFVAMVLSPTRVRVWLEHPQNDKINYDLKQTFEIDLSKTPRNPSIPWDDIEVDDHVNDQVDSAGGGYTSLGPLFPHVYGAAGVYLSDTYVRKHFSPEHIRTLDDLDKMLDGESKMLDEQLKILKGDLYEKSALVRKYSYSGNKSEIKRYHGFHAIKDLRSEGIAKKESGKIEKLLVVAHANLSYEERAPRKFLILEDDFLTTGSTKAGEDLTEKIIYIERDVHRKAFLEVPKRPSGSGLGILAQLATAAKSFALKRGTGNAAASASGNAPVSGGPLNVFDSVVSDEVEIIRNKLHPNWAKILDGNLSSVLNDLKPDDKYTSLDLIGHSGGANGILKLGELSITPGVVDEMFPADDQELQELRKKMLDHGISQIRLLGCRTACSDEARKTIRAIANKLQGTGIEVLGTRADLFAAHYDKGYGFVEEKLLVPDRISQGDGPGDASPTDDDLVVAPPLLKPPPNSSSPAPRLDDISALPDANHVLKYSTEYMFWSLDEIPFEDLKQVIEWDKGNPINLTKATQVANRELVVVDIANSNIVKSLSVFIDKSGNKKHRIQIAYDDGCYSYFVKPITAGMQSDAKIQKVLNLLGIQAR